MILMIDNYDSFTYNLVHYFGELNEEVRTVRNDQITIEEITTLNPDMIVISPGPCTPKQAGISVSVIEKLSDKKPIMGICLGHQSIAEAFGGRIIKANRLVHGKTSMIYHNEEGIFKDIPNPFEATRYHSLIIDRDSLPKQLEVTAWTDEDEIMGVRHRELLVEGVQFHPESILTKHGKDILNNFLKITETDERGN